MTETQRQALMAAEDAFRRYGHHHMLKGDELKKRANYDLADMMAAAQVGAVESDLAAERTARQECQALADCLDMLRADLSAAGVIGTDVAPMFLTEAVLSAVNRERTARIEAQTRLTELQEQVARSGLAHRLAVQEAVAESVAEEREACALVCDELQDVPATEPRHCAASIRARGVA